LAIIKYSNAKTVMRLAMPALVFFLITVQNVIQLFINISLKKKLLILINKLVLVFYVIQINMVIISIKHVNNVILHALSVKDLPHKIVLVA